MQTRAVIEAAIEVRKNKGYDVVPEIMIPLVGEVKELKYVKDIVVNTAEAVMAENNVKFDYHIGTMIEIPRAALTADKIATEAEFFSFGTNDLTQLVQMAAEKGRAVRPNIHLGICGEHGGDPSSIEFCHNVGLDYVSCSPFRVPLARLAAAQAQVKNPR